MPPELGDAPLTTLQHLFDAYRASGASTKADEEMFDIVGKMIGKTQLKAVCYDWVEIWANALGTKHAPSTTKKRVEFLGRALAWGMRKEKLSLLHNPVKQLPKGYATKNVPKERLWAGQRDRRLAPAEEGAVREVLVKKEERLMFDMALETAMRMSEMSTLKWSQVDLGRRTIFLDKTKNGSKRQVPISRVLLKLLSDCEKREGEVFPYWQDPFPEKDSLSDVEQKRYDASVRACTNKLSHLFAARFKKAGATGLRFQDLRHEATSRLYERTKMTDLKIASITGHTNMRMLQRYANLRASELASEMW